MGLALVETPGEWMTGSLSLRTEEHKYFADLAQQARTPDLAFFHVSEVCCIGRYAGLEECDFGDVIPFCWDHRRSKYITEHRHDIIKIDGSRWSRLQCTSPWTSHGHTTSLGSVSQVLAKWERRVGHAVHIDFVWQVWPPIATLLCHAAWHVLAVPGHLQNHNKHVLKVAGVRPRPARYCDDDDAADSDAEADLTCDRFQELGNSIRSWADFILKHQQGALGDRNPSEDIRMSEAYLASWASWSDTCERKLNARDSFFKRKRGRHFEHPLRTLFAAMWVSYKVRRDSLLGEVSLDMFVASSPPILHTWLRENQEFVMKNMPSKPTISRYRLAFDCSFSLGWRSRLLWLLDNTDCKFHMMADSSPFFGRDWFMVQYEDDHHE